jgi:hypothetical protein
VVERASDAAKAARAIRVPNEDIKFTGKGSRERQTGFAIPRIAKGERGHAADVFVKDQLTARRPLGIFPVKASP